MVESSTDRTLEINWQDIKQVAVGVLAAAVSTLIILRNYMNFPVTTLPVVAAMRLWNKFLSQHCGKFCNLMCCFQLYELSVCYRQKKVKFDKILNYKHL